MNDAPYPPLRPQHPVRAHRRDRNRWPMVVGIILLAVPGDRARRPAAGGNPRGPGSRDGQRRAVAHDQPVIESFQLRRRVVAVAVGQHRLDRITRSPRPSLTTRWWRRRSSASRCAVGRRPMPSGSAAWPSGPSASWSTVRSKPTGSAGTRSPGSAFPRTAAARVPETEPINCPAWFGWVAGHAPNGDPWLAPHALECPQAPLDAESLILGRSERRAAGMLRSRTAHVPRLLAGDPRRRRAWWRLPCRFRAQRLAAVPEHQLRPRHLRGERGLLRDRRERVHRPDLRRRNAAARDMDRTDRAPR